MSAPSPGYSITVRAEAPAAIDTTGALAAAVAAAGGALTALDVVGVPQRPDLVVDVTCNASDADHADRITAADRGRPGRDGPQGQRPHLPAPPRRQARGDAQGPAQAPRRPLPRLHARRRPRLPGDRGEPRGRPPADHQAQHRRRRHRRLGGARARQHRARGGAAGDGGQGRAVQAVRRRRRLAGLPRHPGRRADHHDRQGASPRSTAAINLEDISAPRCFEIERPAARRCSTSPSSTTTSTAPRSSCSPP